MEKKAIILGMDGLDHCVLAAMMARGELPHFTRLAQEGCFKPLAPANPAQSPVVWASIATGQNPGKHGVFDFLIRNPKTYMPDLAVLRQARKRLAGLGAPRFEPVMQAAPFWEILANRGVEAAVLKWPVTFPPRKSAARVLSGLGTPDLKGGLGRYTHYTSRHGEGKRGGTVMHLFFQGGRAVSVISGPLVDRVSSGPWEAGVPLEIRLQAGASKAVLKAGGQTLTLEQGRWSPWVRLRFQAGVLKNVSGMCRFFLSSVAPDFSLYMSPVHIDPARPCFPLSSPESYAPDLEGRFGPYHTLGIPEDTNAVVDGVLDAEAFIRSCDDIVGEQERIFFDELERFSQGLLACVFFTTDRIQHIFWAAGDPSHPAHDPDAPAFHFEVIGNYYRKMDRILGRVLESVDDRTLLMVCSDHGFTSFKKSVHLNTWLVKNGFMTLKRTPGPADKDGGPLFENVDWGATRAYALGLGSVFLNLAGREGEGVVPPKDAPELAREIKKALEAWKDPENGAPVVRCVYPRESLYQGPFVEKAPDLIVGFDGGYRMSWQTAVGGAPFHDLEINTTAWTGDHCMDPSLVPGVLLANMKPAANGVRCTGIAPTILDHFGLPCNMDGTSLLGGGQG